jgi:hypothetical protein
LVPTTPPSPATFSTRTCVSRIADSASATRRPSASADPPRARAR